MKIINYIGLRETAAIVYISTNTATCPHSTVESFLKYVGQIMDSRQKHLIACWSNDEIHKSFCLYR